MLASATALDKEIGDNPPVPFGFRAAWGDLLGCGHLKMLGIDCLPDASHLTPRRLEPDPHQYSDGLPAKLRLKPLKDRLFQ